MAKETISKNLKKKIKKHPKIFNFILSLHFSLTKGKVRIAYHKTTRGHVVRGAIIRSFLGKKGPHILQIGGGYHLVKEEGWINGDIIAGDIFLNATKKLPFENESLDAVFAEQFLEHISLESAAFLLKEIHRCLKPNGTIRFATPDLEGLISIYQGNNPIIDENSVIERHMRLHRGSDQVGIQTVARVLNDNFRLWGHQFIYDRNTIKELVKLTGYENLQWRSFGDSSVPTLNNRERHADVEWMKSAYQIIFEANKR
ncbi:class I SAM-dependent methyltransferase [Rhodovulum sp. YNF3179]|uniref:class I SAM-dependent methyltransferase n=1 Tax=Rhodovulum sp. YNF3179 TaxID=3425127 RepID=UPI003D347AF8